MIKDDAKLEIVYLSLDEFTPYEKNARKHQDTDVNAIVESIKQFGMCDPIGIWGEKNIIVEGHGRLLALKKLGYDKAPAIRLDHLTDEQRKAYALAHNRTAELSSWEQEILINEIDDLKDFFDFETLGFNDADYFKDIDKNEGEVVEDDFDVENNLTDEPVAKYGDIYQLGNHRLMCGDSTKMDDIKKLTGGGYIDLVLTDAPYGVNIVQSSKIGGDKPFGKQTGQVGKSNVCKANEYMVIKGDESTETAKKFYDIIKDISKVQILFGGNYFTDFLYPSRCWLVWDKESPKDNYFADVELAWCSLDHNSKIYRWLWNGMCKKGDKKTEGKKRIHPTQKPVGMLGDIIKDFSKENDLIFDGFGGSGSTLIACEQLNRNCYMMEYEPHYVDVIIKRWETFTDKKAIKL